MHGIAMGRLRDFDQRRVPRGMRKSGVCNAGNRIGFFPDVGASFFLPRCLDRPPLSGALRRTVN